MPGFFDEWPSIPVLSVKRVKLGVNDLERADIALKGVRGKRLTYETTRRHRAEGAAA